MQNLAEERRLPGTIPEALARFENSDRTALICGREELRYRELLADARYIAHALKLRGVRKGDRVVLDLHRGADYLRVYLGVILAGGIQVTIHSGWPEKQKERVITDCAPVLIVDDIAAKSLRTADLRTETLCSPLPELQGADPFQIIYTSGSSGVPKGCVNCHETAVQRYLAEASPLPIPQHFTAHCSRMLADANLAFVMTTMQLLLALMNGKTLVLALEEELETPGALASCIRRTGADTMISVISRVYRDLEDPDYRAALNGMRMLNLGGELLEPRLLDAVAEATGADIYCGYGSSETMSVMELRYHKGEACLFQPPAAGSVLCLPEEGGTGRIAPNSRGELCVGGPGGRLGRYWNDPELTAKQYVDHPLFGRLFRTGDMAQSTPDGRLLLLGRRDGMVKLHGMRIETGAVEAAMEAVPGVRRAAVKVQHGEPTEMLCGYYTGNVEPESLRRCLAESLPYYMVPALLRQLPEMPLNPNGKLDRDALPEFQHEAGAYVPPETAEERLLCRAFAEVLHKDALVGIDDSFFELGGDSIRGMAVAAQMKKQGYELKMEWLFAAPTVRLLARMMLPIAPATDTDAEEALWSAELDDTEWACVDASVGRENVETVYPVLLHAKVRAQEKDPFWIFEIYHVSGDFTAEELRRRLADCVRCHQALRSVILREGTPRPLEAVLKKWEIPVFSVDLRRLAATQGEAELSSAQAGYLRSLNRLYVTKPFSSTEVMFEAGIVRLRDDASVLVLAYSHLLLDGAGRVQIWNELIGGAPAVPDCRQYNRYIRRLSVENTEQGRQAWQQALAGRPPLTVFPPPAEAPGGSHGNSTQMLIGGDALAEKLQNYCKKNRLTLSALACFALGRVLMAHCGVGEAAFLFMNSGRDAENIFLTGMFATGFPVFVGKEDTPTSLQEQLMQNMRLPVLDTAELGPGFAYPAAERHVCLSMQNFMNPENARIVVLPPAPGTADVSPGTSTGSTSDKVKPLSVLIFPESPFRIVLLYDRACYGRDEAGVLGRGLLTELRHIADSVEGVQP